MEIGRGGAYVPARVALQGRIHRLFPAHNACIFCMETPLRGRSGGHTGTAPTHFVWWITCGTVDVVWGRLLVDVRPYDFVWADYAWVVLFVCWENGAHEPTPPVLYFCQPRVD